MIDLFGRFFPVLCCGEKKPGEEDAARDPLTFQALSTPSTATAKQLPLATNTRHMPSRRPAEEEDGEGRGCDDGEEGEFGRKEEKLRDAHCGTEGRD